MSTPLQQLPQGAAPPASAKMDDDPSVHEVIQEMEREFQHAQPTPVAVPVVPMQPQAPRMVVHTSIAAPTTSSSSWLHTESAKRAALVAVLALVIFYPEDLSALYQKVPVLGRFAQHDRMIRAAALALVLYVAFWKLEL